MTDGHGERRALRAAVKGALGVGFLALFALPGGPARAAWDGTNHINLGDSVTADFAGAPGDEVHHYGFYTPDLAKITAKTANVKGLTTIVGLHGGFLADAENVEVAPTTTGIVNYVVPRRGAYHLNVASTAGTGTYKLATKVVFNKKPFTGSLTPTTTSTAPAGFTGTYKFGALAGSKISGSIKGATATVQILKITSPSGVVLPVPVKAKKGRDFPANTLSFRNIVLNETGEYLVTLHSTSNTEAIDWNYVIAAPKYKARNFVFPAMDAERGAVETIRERWLESGHADLASESFKHWTGSVPDAIPTSCARCHSATGLEDYLADLTVNTAPRTGTSVECRTCHSDLASGLESVLFPSGLTATGMGDSTRCVACHQGRESTKSVETAITNAALATPDTTSTAIGFRNVHYFAAGATLFGREAEGAYEYPDPSDTSGATDPTTGLTRRLPYDRRFYHVGAADTCVGCHDPHTLERKISYCATCHAVPANVDGTGAVADVADDDDLRRIRMAGTTEDYDGDGNAAEGIYYEMEGLSNILFAAIRDYAQNTLTKGIAYDGHSYPYFFTDANNDGTPDVNATTGAKIGYSPWSPRLLRAAYNYQYFQKDPGAFAHNAKYVIEVMYDSIADIHSVRPVANFASLVRNDKSHFDSSSDAYRDWDSVGLDGSTPSSCARCHTHDGFLFVVQNNFPRTTPTNQPLTSGMKCESCHIDNANFKGDAERRYVDKVTFPWAEQPLVSTAATGSLTKPSTGDQINKVTLYNRAATPDDSFICMTCHQGRQSKLTYDATITANSAFPNPQNLSFANVHYFVAGAVQYSTKAAVGYTWDRHVTGYNATTGATTYGPVTDSALTPFAGTYQGPWTHSRGTALALYRPAVGTTAESGEMMPANAQCTSCHMPDGSHKFAPEGTETCAGCHGDTNVAAYKIGPGIAGVDFDGDATTTTLHAEVDAFRAAVLRELNNYAQRKGKTGVGYNPDVNSYFFFAVPGDYTTGTPRGTASADRYNTFDKYMLYAAHNMHISKKDPGAWAHNARYILQLMYDSADYLDDELWNGSAKNPVNGAPLVRPATQY